MRLAALVANKVTHVFDDAHHGYPHGIEHGKALAAVGEGNFLRSRHHHGTCHRAVLRKRQLNVARSWRKVYQQVVQFSPAHMMNKVLDHLRDHRTAPDGRLVTIREHAHTDDADAALRLDRGNRVILENFRSLVDTEHETHGRTVDIGIQNAHAGTGQTERHCKIRRHGRFADTALATGNSHHMRHVADVRNLRCLRRRIGTFHAALRGKSHLNRTCTERLYDRDTLVLKLVTNRASRSCKAQVKTYLVAIDL